ncbi:MAG TPA: hypothetical protein VGQ80_01550 [Acidimicrobiia bacterium]|nr:hypothetical protein [Acidimicrobiia bacterium]
MARNERGHGRRRWRLATRGLGALVVGGSLLLAAIPGAQADTDFGGFQAFTAASGARATYSVGGFVIAEPIDAGGPVAQATLDSLAGRAFGSVPYPGDAAIRYPGYVALATGSAPPGYPLFAEAQYPQTPEGSYADPSGSLTLGAKTGADSSTGTAAIRAGSADAPASNSLASTSIKKEEGKLVATAESVDRGINVGGALQIGTLVSSSVTTYTPGAQPTTETTLRIEGGRAGEQSFGFGPSGLTLSSTNVPLPGRDGLAALNKALEPAGLVISFAEPVPVTGGAQAAGLVIEKRADLPGAGPGVFRLRFGQATAGIVIEGGMAAPAAPGAASPLPVAEPAGPGADGGSPAVDPASADSPAAPLAAIASGGSEFGERMGQGPTAADGAFPASESAAAAGPPDSTDQPASSAPRRSGGSVAVLPVARAATASGLFADDGDKAVLGAITAVALLGFGAAVLWRRGMAQWTS